MQVIVSPRHKVLGVPDAEAVKNLFPSARTHDFEGQSYRLVPHSETETYMLRQLGYDAPAPILTQYTYPMQMGLAPFDVQKKTCALLTMAQRAYVLNGMGTGKTKCALWSWDHLRVHGRAKKMLVVCPRSTMTFTWVKEAFEVNAQWKVVVLHGDKKTRLARLADPTADIFVINHDGIKVIEKELLAMMGPCIDTLCIDELAKFRNKSDRTKAMIKIANKATWAWGMTGSPMPHEPTDVYYQCRIITPQTVPPYFSHFEAELMYKLTNTSFTKLVPKTDAVERAFDVMQPAVRFTIDEVVELPPCIERWVDVEMGTKQAKVYKDMLAHCQHLAATGELIAAANAGSAMNKLLQISLGWVYASKTNQILPLDNAKRIEALMDAIASTSRKVLVFVPYKHALAGISAALTADNIDHAVVSGDTGDRERNRIFNLFQNTPRYRVLEAHPECLAHGITLTAADTVIWFGPITSNETYDQANHRIKRIGQKHKQQIIHLQSTPVERKVYRMLKTQQNVQTNFLKMFEDSNEAW
jgi:SNF2 family DNA or RNA helicase